jgi:two-component system nitrate/nitrite response regulator NarL
MTLVRAPVKGESIVLGDEQLIFLETLAQSLSNAGHTVAATCSSRAALVAAVRREAPSVCITDSQYSDGDLTDLLEGLAQAWPGCKLIILTNGGSPDLLRTAIDAGALGIVQKNRGLAVLLDVVRRVGLGEIVIEASFAPIRRRTSESVEAHRLARYLTAREYECLSLLIAGSDTSMMAGYLGVSRTTVRSHVQSLLCKLGVHSRLEAVAVATRYGLAASALADTRYTDTAS